MTSKSSTFRVRLLAASALVSLLAGYRFTLPEGGMLKAAKVSVNVTNLNDIKGVSTAVVTGNSGGFQAFPIAPRMAFVTLDASF